MVRRDTNEIAWIAWGERETLALLDRLLDRFFDEVEFV